MKLLFVHHNMVSGGTEIILINLFKVLLAHSDVEIDFLLMNEQELGFYQIPEKVNVFKILNRTEAEFKIYCENKVRQGEEGYFRYWYERIKAEQNTRICNHFNTTSYDLIINSAENFNEYLENYYINGAPIVRWIHNADTLDFWRNYPHQFKPLIEKQGPFISICDEMLGITKNVFNELGIQDKEHYRIYNPIEVERIKFLQNEAVNEADQQLLNDNYLLQVGRLTDVKNHKQMINIFKKLKDKGIKEKLYIIGFGNEAEQATLKEHIASLGLEQECLLLGTRYNPYPFMKNAKLFIHTALNEGLCTVIIESMVCGVPTVVMDCPTGMKEILDNGKYGELIPLGDEDLFVEKTYELLTNDEKYQDYVKLLPESVKRFDFDTIGNEVYNLFQKIIANK